MVPACRSSEAWLRVDVDGRMHWMVCDAMMNVQTLPSSTLLRWAVLLYGIRTGLHVSPMFRHVIIRDKRTFRTWALDKLRAAPDNVLVPCHGHVADEPNLTGRLVELIERRF